MPHLEFFKQVGEVNKRVTHVGIFRIKRDALDLGVSLSVLEFKPRHQQNCFTHAADDQRNRALGRDKRKTGQVEDRCTTPPDKAAVSLSEVFA